MKNKLNPLFLLGIFVLLNLTLTVSEAAPLDFPDTPAGKRAEEIVALLNETFSRPAEDYIQNDYTPGFRDAFPIAAHRQIFDTTRTMFGRLELADISSSTPLEIRFALRSEKRDAWLNISLMVEADPPYRIASLGISPGARPASSEGKDKSDTEASRDSGTESLPVSAKKPSDVDADELHQMITAKVEAGEFSGVVLVAKDSLPLFHKAYGYASKRFKSPNLPDTKFNLGSCNKSFTAVALAQLAEKGQLSLDDPIGKYLDIFPPEIAGKVTIRFLLNMRSGWGDYWGNEAYMARFTRLCAVSDYMEFIKSMPLDFEPGTNFQHSNTGFEVAGAIIEKVTGMDYYTYVKANIYDRAGMADTDSYHKDGPVENLAVGYTNMNRNDPEGTGYRWANTYMMPPRGTPAGGGYSTAGDLLKYGLALQGNRLLGKAFTDYLLNRFEGQPGDPDVAGKSYRTVGGAPGINADLFIDPVSGYTIVVLSNYDHPAAMILTDEILKRYGLK